MPLVVVDAENVRRSLWPNLSAEELVARFCRDMRTSPDVEIVRIEFAYE